MNSVVELRSREASVHIYAGAPGWVPCVHFNSNDGKVHYLGADSLNTIRKRLMPVLNTQWEQLAQQVAGQVEGHPVKWVLSLSEAHAALYVASDGEGRILFWQDSRWGLGILRAMHLTRDILAEWNSLLTSFKYP